MKAVSRNSRSTITVHVPLTFMRRGNSKRIVGANGQPPCLRIESALIKALARAYRWRRKIESEEFASITELAKAEKVNQSYACRVLRLTLLSPGVVNEILDGRLNPAPTVNELMKPFSQVWREQGKRFGFSAQIHGSIKMRG